MQSTRRWLQFISTTYSSTPQMVVFFGFSSTWMEHTTMFTSAPRQIVSPISVSYASSDSYHLHQTLNFPFPSLHQDDSLDLHQTTMFFSQGKTTGYEAFLTPASQGHVAGGKSIYHHISVEPSIWKKTHLYIIICQLGSTSIGQLGSSPPRRETSEINTYFGLIFHQR